MPMRLAAHSLALIALLSSPASAQEAHLGRLSWSAFHCSSLASQSAQADEQQRLFQVGYESGLRYIEAVRAGRVTEEQVRSETPIGFSLGLGGPSPDFMLGRIYETAADKAYDDVTEQISTPNAFDAEIRQVVAGNLFQQSNCTLLR